MKFYKLKVIDIRRPIKDATTVSLKVPNNLVDPFEYHPGQHLIFKFIIDGKEVRRSYSLNSCPLSDEILEVTVKRVKDGLVSNYINDHLAIGDEVDNQETIIFKEELEELQKQNAERLTITHTLSSPKTWSSWKQWQGRKGRVNVDNVEWFIANHPPIAQSTEYYICGPGAMNKSVKNTLTGLGIPKDLIHIEQFGGNVEEEAKAINSVDNAQVTATLSGKTHIIKVPKGQSILDVLKSSGANPPYSCESGICGTCVAKVNSGNVEMKSCMALDEKDVEKGLILACQGVPMSEKVVVVF